VKILKSKWFGIGLIVLLAVSSYFLLQWGAKIAVKDFLNRKIPNNISFVYEELIVDFLEGNLLFLRPEIEIRHNTTDIEQLTVNLEEIGIEDIHYWKLFYHKEIVVSQILIDEPDFTFHKRESHKEKPDKVIKLLKPIYVEDLVVKNGSVRIIEEDSLEVLRLDSLNVDLNGGQTNIGIVNKKIPFEYNSIVVDLKNFSALLGKYEKIETDGFKLDNDEIILSNTHMFTKVSKQELSQQIPYERDHLNLEIEETIITDFNFNFDQDSLLVTANSGDISKLKLEIFRDKNPPDDMRDKFLYAKMLKSLPFHIDIETFNISDSNLVYEEEEEKKVNPGELRFENLSGQIKNISNLPNEEDEMQIVVKSDLMGKGLLHLDWSFKVNDPDQRFLVQGSLINFDTTSLNDFLVPSLNVKTEGQIEQLYFTVSGNEYVANGDVKMRYNDFKFQVLGKNGLRINKVLTFIGNLFIDDGSKTDENGYRYGAIENVERNQKKSFFNFLWISLQEGLLHLLSGNGKKK
jgi:hypothetical protein